MQEYLAAWEWIHAQDRDTLEKFYNDNKDESSLDEIQVPWGGKSELRGDFLTLLRSALD